jgi:hypothetical protein
VAIVAVVKRELGLGEPRAVRATTLLDAAAAGGMMA